MFLVLKLNVLNNFYTIKGNLNDLTPVPNECAKFFRCRNNQLEILTCPPMGVFDSTRKMCDLPVNVVGKCGLMNCPEADHTIVPNTSNKF
jgi:hypothetical protein